MGSLVSDLLLLITFGYTCPPVAAIIIIDNYMRTMFWKISIGRVLELVAYDDPTTLAAQTITTVQKKAIIKLMNNSAVGFTGFVKKSISILLWCSVVLVVMLMVDYLTDRDETESAIWIIVITILTPICFYVLIFSYYSPFKLATESNAVELLLHNMSGLSSRRVRNSDTYQRKSELFSELSLKAADLELTEREVTNVIHRNSISIQSVNSPIL